MGLSGKGSGAAMRLAWIGVAALLSGCVGQGGTDASAPMTSTAGASGETQTDGMMLHSAGSGAAMGSDTEAGGAASQRGTSMGAGGIGNGIPQ